MKVLPSNHDRLEKEYISLNLDIGVHDRILNRLSQEGGLITWEVTIS